MKSNETNNNWFDIKLLILFSWNWYLDNNKKLSELNQVLSHIKIRIIKKKKKMIFETEMIKLKNEIEYDIEYQDFFDFSLLTFRRKWVDIKRENNENINWLFHRL